MPRTAAVPFLLLALAAVVLPAHAAKEGRTTSTTPPPAAGADPGVVPGELLLKLSSGDRLPSLLSSHSLTLLARLGPRPIFRVQVPANARIDDVAAALAAEPGVLIAEPNVRHAGPEAAKNNVWAIGSQTAYVAQWALAALRLPEAWATSQGAGMRVAVLDTGVDRSHPLLAPRLLPGSDFVDGDLDPSEAGTRTDPGFGHGTHVAGLVALAAPAAQILPLRVLDAHGVGDTWTLAAAMLYAADPDGNPATDDGAQVINLSLAGPRRTRLFDTVALLTSCTVPEVVDPADDLSDAGYDDDRRRCSAAGGAVVVAAAGNDASATLKTYPAAEGAYGLVSVAASAPDRRLAGFSNSGKWIQLAAPGEGLTSSVPGGWGTWSGTSMAAPLVAGVAALLRAAAPQLSASDAERCLTRATTPLAGTSIGQLDAAALLNNLGSRKLCR